MPVQADMRSLIFNLAVASGDAATYKAVQKLYIEVCGPTPAPCRFNCCSMLCLQYPAMGTVTSPA